MIDKTKYYNLYFLGKYAVAMCRLELEHNLDILLGNMTPLKKEEQIHWFKMIKLSTTFGLFDTLYDQLQITKEDTLYPVEKIDIIRSELKNLIND